MSSIFLRGEELRSPDLVGATTKWGGSFFGKRLEGAAKERNRGRRPKSKHVLVNAWESRRKKVMMVSRKKRWGSQKSAMIGDGPLHWQKGHSALLMTLTDQDQTRILGRPFPDPTKRGVGEKYGWLRVFNLSVASSFCILHCFVHNLFIRTSNDSILVSTESPRSLDAAHANEGAIEGHHAGEMIICLLRLHDDFVDFSLILLVSTPWLA